MSEPDWPKIDAALEVYKEARMAGHIGFRYSDRHRWVLGQLVHWLLVDPPVYGPILTKIAALHDQYVEQEPQVIRAVNTTNPNQLTT